VTAGEWIFTTALFGPQSVDPVGYLRWVRDRAPGFFTQAYLRQLLNAQAQAESFLKHCLEDLDWGAYDVVGFSSSFQQHNASLALAKRVKQRWPEKKNIFGGSNVEGVMGVELLRTFDFVDYACLGEGDALLPEFVRRLRAGQVLEDIPGLALRRDGRVCATDPRLATVLDLDGLPYPDYDDFFVQHQALFGTNGWPGSLCFETSRGCWWGERQQCAWCGFNGCSIGYRSKSPQRALDEIEHLAQRYDARLLRATDSVAPRDLGALLPTLQARSPHLHLFYYLRATVGKERLAQMKRAGVDLVAIGIENLSTPILRLMGKGTTALINIQALKWCRELGIRVGWNLLLGVSFEEQSEYQRMAHLVPSLTHLTPPGNCGYVRLHRFSPYFHKPARYGLANVRPTATYAHVCPGVPEAALRNLAYVFDFDYADGRDPATYTTPTVQAVEAWREAAPTSLLAYVDDGERLRLFDTRPVARERVRALAGLERPLYLACDRQQSLKRLGRRFAGVEPDALQQALERMVEERVMVAEDQKYLSLAVDIGQHLKPQQRAQVSDDFCLALTHALMGTKPITNR
jgi:ribosomal peptide maturation radical SAM protein 1